jgi:hypothetical protein
MGEYYRKYYIENRDLFVTESEKAMWKHLENEYHQIIGGDDG